MEKMEVQTLVELVSVAKLVNILDSAPVGCT